jgi:hypothetical protein
MFISNTAALAGKWWNVAYEWNVTPPPPPKKRNPFYKLKLIPEIIPSGTFDTSCIRNTYRAGIIRSRRLQSLNVLLRWQMIVLCSTRGGRAQFEARTVTRTVQRMLFMSLPGPHSRCRVADPPLCTYSHHSFVSICTCWSIKNGFRSHKVFS